MILKKQYSYIFYLSLGLLVTILLFTIDSLSISYKEALNVFENNSILTYITKISIYIFGQNDYALRIPFILFYILSSLLMYEITKNYFKNEKDRLINVLIFMLLPGVVSASLLVNSAILVIFLTLLYVYLFIKFKKHNYILLLFLLFCDNSFIILFLAIVFHSIKKEDKKSLFIALFLVITSFIIYGFDAYEKPKGFFLDTFAVYASIFSPLVFIYFLYTIYRDGVKKKSKSFIWYISATALLISFILSFRQKVYIEDFAPYVVIALPLMLKNFFHSYRIRLPQFRKKHNVAISFVLFMLFVNVFLTIFNKPLYLLIEKPNKHFVYNYHFVKELSNKLKELNIDNVKANNKELQIRLKFYNIKEGNDYFISNKRISQYDRLIKIKYIGKNVMKYYVKKNEK